MDGSSQTEGGEPFGLGLGVVVSRPEERTNRAMPDVAFGQPMMFDCIVSLQVYIRRTEKRLHKSRLDIAR